MEEHEKLVNDDRLNALILSPRFVQKFARPFKIAVLTPWQTLPGEEWRGDSAPKSSELTTVEIKTTDDLTELQKKVLAGEYREWATAPIQQQLWAVLARFSGFIIDGPLAEDTPLPEVKCE